MPGQPERERVVWSTRFCTELYRIEQFKRSDLAKYSPAAVTGQLISAWRDARLGEVSSGTVLREMQLLSHLFSVAMREWGIALHSNPVNLVRKPAPGKARDKVLTDAQREALLLACGQCKNPWIKPVVPPLPICNVPLLIVALRWYPELAVTTAVAASMEIETPDASCPCA